MTVSSLIEQADSLTKDRVARNAEIKQLREALTTIVSIPSEATLLLNAEARAMYEVALQTLETERAR